MDNTVDQLITDIKLYIKDSLKIYYFKSKAYIFWNYVPGTIVTVSWPVAGAFSCDPNDFYRPYLEQRVGSQTWDWDWRIAKNSMSDLEIKLRKKRQHYASILKLMWN